jgi:steroid 5-alpha reductase family enzyme
MDIEKNQEFANTVLDPLKFLIVKSSKTLIFKPWEFCFGILHWGKPFSRTHSQKKDHVQLLFLCLVIPWSLSLTLHL